MDDKLHLEKIKSEIIVLQKNIKLIKTMYLSQHIMFLFGKVLDENDLINTILSSLDMVHSRRLYKTI